MLSHKAILKTPKGINISYAIYQQGDANFHSHDGNHLKVQVKGGSGVPLIMVQGLTGSKENWDGLHLKLAKKRTVLVFDNRGVGETTYPDTQFSIEDLAEDVVDLSKALGWERFDLFGISMGGAISQAVAINHGDRIRKLILGCTSPRAGDYINKLSSSLGMSRTNNQGANPNDNKKKSREERVRDSMAINYTEKWMAENPQKLAELVKLEMSLKKSLSGIEKQFNARLKFDSTERLHQIKNPTLIIAGSGDRLTPYENSLRLQRLIPNSHFHLIHEAGHGFWTTHPDQTLEIIERFLDLQLSHL